MLLLLPTTSHALLLSNGDVQWTLSTSDYDVTLVFPSGVTGDGGTMTLTRRSDSQSIKAVMISSGVINSATSDSFYALTTPFVDGWWAFSGSACPSRRRGVLVLIPLALLALTKKRAPGA
jgi:hypothetical protein